VWGGGGGGGGGGAPRARDGLLLLADLGCFLFYYNLLEIFEKKGVLPLLPKLVT